jgi:WD40 repeat protein
MDRRRLAAAPLIAAVAVAGAGCGGSGPRPLLPGAIASAAPVGLGDGQVLRRGALGYRAAFLGPRLWLAAELGVRFELVVRRLGPGGWQESGRLDLGPPEWDITGLATAPGGRRAWIGRGRASAWIGSTDGTVRGIDVERREVVARWPMGAPVTAVAASPRGLVAAGSERGVVCLRRVGDGALLQCLAAHRGRVSALAFAGDRLASASWDGSVALWSVPALRRLAVFEVEGSANDVALSGDSLAVAVSDRAPGKSRRARPAGAGAIAVIPAGGGPTLHCRGHRAPATAVAWTGAASLVTGSWDRTIRLWSIEDGRCRERARRQLDGHLIDDLAVAPGGRHLAVSLWGTKLEQPSAIGFDLLYR